MHTVSELDTALDCLHTARVNARDTELHPYFEPDVLALVHELNCRQAEPKTTLSTQDLHEVRVAQIIDRVVVMQQGMREDLAEVLEVVMRIAEILAGEA